MRTAFKYGGSLIALFLVLDYATGAGILLKDGTSGGVSLVKALQGRG